MIFKNVYIPEDKRLWPKIPIRKHSQIRMAVARGESMHKLAEKYAVTYHCIWRIINYVRRRLQEKGYKRKPQKRTVDYKKRHAKRMLQFSPEKTHEKWRRD